VKIEEDEGRGKMEFQERVNVWEKK